MQENSRDIPSGSMPRALSVVVRNDAVEVAKPGDRVLLCGCLIVLPDVSALAGSSLGKTRITKATAEPATEGTSTYAL